jgi:hypothetical protein
MRLFLSWLTLWSGELLSAEFGTSPYLNAILAIAEGAEDRRAAVVLLEFGELLSELDLREPPVGALARPSRPARNRREAWGHAQDAASSAAKALAAWLECERPTTEQLHEARAVAAAAYLETVGALTWHGMPHDIEPQTVWDEDVANVAFSAYRRAHGAARRLWELGRRGWAVGERRASEECAEEGAVGDASDTELHDLLSDLRNAELTGVDPFGATAPSALRVSTGGAT